MTFELGVYSFGNTPRLPDGSRGPTAQALRDVLEAIKLADEVGLDFFGVGEHHMRAMPLSSPTSVVNAAAAVTKRIKLGTTVTVLSTDDPIRVFQQLATAASLAPGRIELVAGRGSSTITFPLFDHDEHDYDMLYASKLDLLMAVNAGENVTWHGPHRSRPLRDVTVFPRPEEPLRIWLGTGGSPNSVGRAVELGLPMFLGVLGGTPGHWARYGHAYRNAWTASGHPAERADIAVSAHGFVAESGTRARATYLEYEHRMMAEGLAELGRPAPSRTDRAANYGPNGMVFVGGPDEIADRILHLHQLLGHTRQILQMDVGGMPQRDFLRGIELLGTKVLPQMHAELTTKS
ncbi:LLM class flavin-dependent oxidoreductase [Streptomyces caniscabiei]|uniref:LLM class flavin-dependent oxidoreductase n=1 Tax=Streptomyces caniscabiei TaxID=2746961 RepID=A0A927QP34_9ACTN|nr:LLM class flavin-dependent oxidoreductase [Streptomyces caniscabiei]MBD9727334.1 LLM class flavin-dependent oxidoreductase [Streptomyces caniscabiei]MDX3512787.1 LLM class flavin-dependent oxidoreductase [Streptomyces caniscabiei]MDX3722312.1 LLM class flavin-dependent oxidoreductase [Streptomyces caniscabiei]WEO28711.1 LLM class flavin-dependent oxidoreductase [Streptomyces caniscabiei]